MRLPARSIPLLAILLACEASAVQPGTVKSIPETERAEHATMDYLRSALRSTGKAARVYFEGACLVGDGYNEVLFPIIRPLAPSPGSKGLAGVLEIFRNENNIRVTESDDRIIRIVIGQVPRTDLDAKIPIILFDPYEQYTEKMAIWAISDADEATVPDNRARLLPAGPIVRSSLGREPEEGLPHLPAALINTTRDQALDAVATTFGGIVVYGVCKDPGRYLVYFVTTQTNPR